MTALGRYLEKSMLKTNDESSNLQAFSVTVFCCFIIGCNHRSQDERTDSIGVLSEAMKTEYRDQLKRDPNKDFNSEFVRTTDLERKLINEYGYEAIKLIFEDRNSANYFQLGEFPADCPWEGLNKKEVGTAIETVFAPIKKRIPELARALNDRCQYIYAEKANEKWSLHYFLDITLYDGRAYYHIYTGGAPNPRPEISRNLAAYQWDIPKDLNRLYAIHDGFGPVLGSGGISVMAEMMDPICQKQNTFPDGYRFEDLLEFHPDGAGNAQCFHRQRNNVSTVDWDHETWEISGQKDFFKYIDDELSKLDEE